ncbi:MAG: branched-chain amino acid ABC transporter permease [Alphaproteobacteria bacterium]|nr:branched-chain amino acid ABC transporter permease [Alphaproteobacteria bacterium]
MELLFAHPSFAAIQLLNALALAMNLFITAVGLTLVFGVLRVINFAHGAFYMLGAYIAFSLLGYLGGEHWGHFVLAVVGAMLALVIIALLIERYLLRRLYREDHLIQLLFSFALVLIFTDLVRAIWGGEQYTMPYPVGLSGSISLGGFIYPQYLLFLIVAGVSIAVSLGLFLNHTRMGKFLIAAQWDRDMLEVLGVDVGKVYAGVFALGAALAALGGALAAPRMAIEPGMSALVIIDCFIIVILGGFGSLWGSFFGALIIGLSKVFGTFLLQQWEIVLVYGLLVAVMVVRPWGLFGTPDQGRD